MLPPPGLLTTVSGVPSRRFSAMMRSTVRAVLSLLPPGAEGTTISIFFCGFQSVCAWASDELTSSATAHVQACTSIPLLRAQRRPQRIGAVSGHRASELDPPSGLVAEFLAPRPQP